jgi:hypothetical protein
VTVIVIKADPVSAAAGSREIVRISPDPPKVMLPRGTKVVLEEEAASVKPSGDSMSSRSNPINPLDQPCWMVRSPMALMEGASLTDKTSNSKLLEAVAPASSLTLNVIVVLP